jgi:hypothetical protein
MQSQNYDSFLTSMMSPSMLGSTVPDPTNFHSASDKHPNFWHLNVLVFGAVLEVVCVSLPGYIIARQGMFDAESQKFLANLNVMLFTPCLSKFSQAYLQSRTHYHSMDKTSFTAYSG